jgi:ribosomal protein S18 acetylase RimI-like enzyme
MKLEAPDDATGKADAVPVEIRPAAPTELEALHALRLESLRESPGAFGSTHATEVTKEPESRAQWVTDGVAMVAVDGRDWLGLARGVLADRAVEIYAMWVSPERRREGIARALLRAVVDWGAKRGATTARLMVVDDNEPATELYRSEGFVLTGEREPLRSDETHDVVALTKSLT